MIFVLKLILFFSLLYSVSKYFSVMACVVWKPSHLICKADRLTGFRIVQFFYREVFPEVYPKPNWASAAEIFVKIINAFWSLVIMAETSVSDV